MFEGLKRVLGLGKKKKEEIPSPAELPAPETETPIENTASVPAAAPAPAEKKPEPTPVVPTPAVEEEEETRGPSIFSRLKTLVVDREFVLSEKDIEETLFDLQMVLLEADVAYPVAEAITEHMKKELVGTHRKMFDSADKVVTEALKHAIENVLGDGFDLVQYINTHEKPVKILFTGVNGTGKTTSVAKIAALLQSQGFSVVVGAGDTFRAGAVEQIRVHCDRLGVKLIAHQEGADPSAVLFDTVDYAKAHNTDVVLADSAGRFHNRVNLMNQLDKIKRVMKPDLVFYVDEAVAGNDAVIRAEEFEKTVSTDGVILTKLDGDTRGGVALSVKAVTGKPIMFAGVGEKLDQLQEFHPDRMASRILGMGDVLSLIEKAEQAYDEKKAMELEKKIRESTFTLDDYLDQFAQIKGMGSLESLAAMMPGVKPGALKDAKIDEKAIARTEAIIKSMTKREREKPDILNASRKKRIAAGSGTTVEEVNKLLKQFEQTRALMKQFADPKKMAKLGRRGMKMPF